MKLDNFNVALKCRYGLLSVLLFSGRLLIPLGTAADDRLEVDKHNPTFRTAGLGFTKMRRSCLRQTRISTLTRLTACPAGRASECALRQFYRDVTVAGSVTCAPARPHPRGGYPALRLNEEVISSPILRTIYASALSRYQPLSHASQETHRFHQGPLKAQQELAARDLAGSHTRQVRARLLDVQQREALLFQMPDEMNQGRLGCVAY